MNIKAIIPAGITEITVNGLHQWDYGRKLEIHSPDLPAIVEVHFACAGMTEAVVRSCTATNGVAVAAIPDICLEQTSPITAWVYLVGESSGATAKTVTLTVIERTRPQPTETIPEDISNKYTEAISAMNDAVDDIINGEYKVKSADHAIVADNATNADHAIVADNATSATNATNATNATSATNATNATNVVVSTDAGDKFHMVTFVSGTGKRPILGNAGLQYNPTTKVLRAPNIEGNATSANSLNPTYQTHTTLTKGEGQISTLTDNTVYLVVATYTSRTGVTVSGSGVFLYVNASTTHGMMLGEFYVEIHSDASVYAIDIHEAYATMPTILLNFYKIGTPPES